MTERVWTVSEAMAWTVDYFSRRGVADPRRSAEWLMSAATGLSRVEIYAYHDRPLTAEERAALHRDIEERAAGEPLQYVTGEMPFRHLVLRVRRGVFIPRPETEILVDEALRCMPPEAPRFSPVVVDLCTGCGAVAASIAKERPDARVFATDISLDAAELAVENAQRAKVGERVDVRFGDLFAPLPPELRGAVDLVVANPPYIPRGDLASLPSEVADFEPTEALDGGEDGLDLVRRIADEAREWLKPRGALVIETDAARTKDAAHALAAWYEGTRVIQDLTGRDRVVSGRFTGGP